MKSHSHVISHLNPNTFVSFFHHLSQNCIFPPYLKQFLTTTNLSQCQNLLGDLSCLALYANTSPSEGKQIICLKCNSDQESTPHIYLKSYYKKKKAENNNCQQAHGEIGIVVQCWWDCKTVQPTKERVWQFLKKLEIKLPYDPIISLLSIVPKVKAGSPCNMCAPLFIVLFTTAKRQKKHRVQL